jgi:hypothetical protein
VEMDRLQNFRVRKSAGIWRLHGDQRMVETEGDVHVYRDLRNNCTMTGLEFIIQDNDSGNNGGAIDHFVVRGPGLPAGGLRYVSSGGGSWVIDGKPSGYHVMANSCAPSQPIPDSAIALIPDNAVYLITAYSSVDNSAEVNFPTGAIVDPSNTLANGSYSVQIEKRPPTLAEAIASTRFPTITAPATPDAFDNYIGGSLHIVAGNLNPNMYADVILERSTVNEGFSSDDTFQAPTSTGAIDTTLQLSTPSGGDTITYRRLLVGTSDNYRRSFMVGE